MDSNEDEADPLVILRNEVGHVSLKALKLSTRMNLCMMLDPPRPIPTKDGLLKDWQGIAELAHYENSFIMELRSSSRPTETLLAHWETKENATVGLLIDALIKLDRFDVIDDLADQFRENVAIYNQNLAAPTEAKIEYQNGIVSRIIDVNDVNLMTSVNDPNISTMSVWDNNTEMITRHDEPLNIQRYDAYVCYTEEDEDFVIELVHELGDEFKLCIKDRDLLPGCFEHRAIIELIQQRCEKFLVILSPAFLASSKLEFQTMFAHACSLEERTRKVVPVVYKKCRVPYLISSLAKLDYTKNTFNNFWIRLKLSIQGANSIPTLSSSRSLLSLQSNRDDSFLSFSSNTSGYSSFYAQPASEGNLSELGAQVISQEFNSPEAVSVSESEISTDTVKKKKKRRLLPFKKKIK